MDDTQITSPATDDVGSDTDAGAGEGEQASTQNGAALGAGEEIPTGAPGFRERGRMRRRARFLRRARELAYRDLGGLVFDLHRFAQRNDALVLAKLDTIGRIDGELRALETALAERQPAAVLREAGVAACPRCAAIHGSDDRFCPNCGLAMDPRAERPVAGAVAVSPAPGGASPTSGVASPAPGPASPVPEVAGPTPGMPSPTPATTSGPAAAAPGAPAPAPGAAGSAIAPTPTVAPAPTGPGFAPGPGAAPSQAQASPADEQTQTRAPAPGTASSQAEAPGKAPSPGKSQPAGPAPGVDQPTEIIRPAAREE